MGTSLSHGMEDSMEAARCCSSALALRPSSCCASDADADEPNEPRLNWTRDAREAMKCRHHLAGFRESRTGGVVIVQHPRGDQRESV
eukprot:scaffold100326_cov31-Tisochrysis_lutea.AAC.2